MRQKDWKNIYTGIIVLSVIIILLITFVSNKKIVPVVQNGVETEHCFFGNESENMEKYIGIILEDDKIEGFYEVYDLIVNEFSGGKFKGSVTDIDAVRDVVIIDGLRSYNKGGYDIIEQQMFTVLPSRIDIAEGERKEDEIGVFRYKDIENLNWEQSLNRIDCMDFYTRYEERANRIIYLEKSFAGEVDPPYMIKYFLNEATDGATEVTEQSKIKDLLDNDAVESRAYYLLKDRLQIEDAEALELWSELLELETVQDWIDLISDRYYPNTR